MTVLDDAFLSLGSTPVSDDAPAGSSARYEPEYEALEAEVAKLQSMSGEQPDWKQVVAAGTTILKDKSKDLLAASYLTRGLFATDGYAGLAAGLSIIRDMIDTHWDALFPAAKRMRARANALGWLTGQLGRVVEGSKPSASDREAVARAFEAIQDIEQASNDKMARHAPALGDLRRALKAHHDDLEASAQPAEPEPAAAEPPPQPAAPPPPAKPVPAAEPPAVQVGDLGSEQDARKAVRACQDALRKIAAFKRGHNLADPAAYQLFRVAVWMPVERMPPNEGGQTPLPPLDDERIGFVEGRVAAGDPSATIAAAEAAFADAMFWLTPHRLTATALEGLGHEQASDAVKTTLAGFLKRHPGIEALSFAGGLPFADDTTRAWIASDVLAAGDGGAAPAGPAGDGEGWRQAAAAAQKFAASGKVREGVALFQQGLATARGGRERCLWQLEQARFCLLAGHPELAAPQLEDLDDQAATLGLEQWEPALSLEIAKALLGCYTNARLKSDLRGDQVDRMRRQRAILSRLDIAAALEMKL